MSKYESTFIISPDVPAEKVEELVEKAKKIAATAGGKVELVQQLGKKKLAYPIAKFKEGSYVYMELTGEGDMMAQLENFYHVNDPIIRYLNIKVEKKRVIVKKAPAPETAAKVEVNQDDATKSSTAGAE